MHIHTETYIQIDKYSFIIFGGVAKYFLQTIINEENLILIG